MKNFSLCHIGIAVKNISEARKFYQNILGLNEIAGEVVEDQKANTLFLELGDSKIELLEPLSSEGPVAKHLSKFGEGIHHIALYVENLQETLDKLKQMDVWVIDEKPRKGAFNNSIAFLHPVSSHGVLIELIERPKGRNQMG